MWSDSVGTAIEQFELTTVFEQYDKGAVPGQKVQHEVTVPEREGYHVIFAVWDVANTANAFYHVIDADFSGDSSVPNPDPDPNPEPNPPKEILRIQPSTYLQGNQVIYDGLEYEARWWT